MHTSDEPIQSNLADVPGRRTKIRCCHGVTHALPDGCVLSNEEELTTL